MSRLNEALFISACRYFDQDFEALMQLLGLAGEAVLSRDAVEANISKTRSNVGLSEEALANLQRWYSEDIKFYLLCDELRSRFRADR